MKYLIVILTAPILLIANLLGGLSALFFVGAMNGYEAVMLLLKKAQEK
jgi:hypothetical protein